MDSDSDRTINTAITEKTGRSGKTFVSSKSLRSQRSKSGKDDSATRRAKIDLERSEAGYNELPAPLQKGDKRLLRGLGYKTLHSRTNLFRSRLIEEFRMLESAHDKKLSQDTPSYTTRDLALDPQAFRNLLRDAPQQLVKFKVFKRSQEEEKKKKKKSDPLEPSMWELEEDETQQKPKKDKRMTRVKNMTRVPLGVWASWVVNTKLFNSFIMFLILGNALLLGIQSELPAEDHPDAHKVLRIIDLFILVVFSIEIWLKWIDDFKMFWRDSWNVFDFIITVMSAIPEIIAIIVPDSSRTLGSVVRQLRVFRTFRSLKMIVRFRSLKIIVRTILDAFQSMTFILLLLVLLLYIYAIFAINSFEVYSWSTRADLLYKDKFKTFGASFLTLFQLLTLDQWYHLHADFSRIADPFITTFFYFSWVWIGAFIFRNIFVGVMVRNFQNINADLTEMEEREKKRKEQAKKYKRLQKILKLRKARDARRKKGQPEPTGGEGRGYGSDPLQDDIYVQEEELSSWEDTVTKTLTTMKEKKVETLWPRDTLFRYLKTMERLQENIREYQELQQLAAQALVTLSDSSERDAS